MGGLEHNLPLDVVCFHIQQTAEKLLKALLASRGVEYPFIHDLEDLLTLAEQQFPQLEEFRDLLPGYSFFAVAMRYDESIYPNREETLAAFETVERFRSVVHSLLPPDTRP